MGTIPKTSYKSVTTSDGEVFEWWQIQDAKEDELERDRRAFSKAEPDIIIKAFYESEKDSERHAAPLIEFLFLTGCRPGEAFALRWADVMFYRDLIRFSKSYNGRLKNIQVTKNNTIRMFQLYPRLTDLMTKIKPENVKGTDLVFQQQRSAPYNSCVHKNLWKGQSPTFNNVTYHYPGVVTRLVTEGKISGYLPPYHARHTYITLTAWANSSNSSALMLLAHSCGNSVEVILAHYLGVDKSVKLTQV